MATPEPAPKEAPVAQNDDEIFAAVVEQFEKTGSVVAEVPLANSSSVVEDKPEEPQNEQPPPEGEEKEEHQLEHQLDHLQTLLQMAETQASADDAAAALTDMVNTAFEDPTNPTVSLLNATTTDNILDIFGLTETPKKQRKTPLRRRAQQQQEKADMMAVVAAASSIVESSKGVAEEEDIQEETKEEVANLPTDEPTETVYTEANAPVKDEMVEAPTETAENNLPEAESMVEVETDTETKTGNADTTTLKETKEEVDEMTYSKTEETEVDIQVPPPEEHSFEDRDVTTSVSEGNLEQATALMSELKQEVIDLRAENKRIKANHTQLTKVHEESVASFDALHAHSQALQQKWDQSRVVLAESHMVLSESRDEMYTQQAAYTSQEKARMCYENALLRVVELVQLQHAHELEAGMNYNARLVEQVLEVAMKAHAGVTNPEEETLSASKSTAASHDSQTSNMMAPSLTTSTEESISNTSATSANSIADSKKSLSFMNKEATTVEDTKAEGPFAALVKACAWSA